MKFDIGDRVTIIGEDLTGWVGTVKKLFSAGSKPAYSVDLDEGGGVDMSGLYFEEHELEKI
jgi:hypothetical protein